MKNVSASLTLLVALTYLSGCTALGPTTSPDWRAQVSSTVPSGDGAVDFLSAGEWFPDTQGFMDMRGAGMLTAQTNFRQGVFALTPISLVFLQWDSTVKRYSVIYRTPYADISEAKVDSLGRGRRLVIFGKENRAQSFGLSGVTGNMVDQAAVQKAYELVSERIRKP
jgi:hypothetical protein